MYLVLSSICCLAYNRSLRTNLLWPEGSPWKGRIFLVTLKHVLAMECCKNFTDVNWREAQSESKCSFLGQNIGCSHGEPLYPEMVRALTKGIITITCLGAVQHRKACQKTGMPVGGNPQDSVVWTSELRGTGPIGLRRRPRLYNYKGL